MIYRIRIHRRGLSRARAEAIAEAKRAATGADWRAVIFDGANPADAWRVILLRPGEESGFGADLEAGAATVAAEAERDRGALAKANDHRQYQAAVKRWLGDGSLSLGLALERRHDERLATMQPVHLLLALPRIGRAKARDLLVRAGIGPGSRLGDLTDRQATALETAVLDLGHGSQVQS